MDPEHPWRVSTWEESIGVGQGKTNLSRWNHAWDDVSLYEWNIGAWSVGPSLRYFDTFNGTTDDGFSFDNSTTSFGAAFHHASTRAVSPSEWTIRIMGERRKEYGENNSTGYASTQKTNRAHWDASYVIWPDNDIVREVSLWADHSIDIGHDASATIPTTGEQKTEFRLGGIADFFHSPENNLTVGLGLEHILASEERTSKRMSPLVRVRLWKRWNATAWYSDVDSARGVSVFFRVWGNE